MKKYKLRKFKLGVVTFIILLYFETVFRLLTNGIIFSKDIIYVLLFNLTFSLLIELIGRLFSKFNKVLYLIFLFLLGLLYSVNLCVYKMFGLFFNFSLLGASDQVAKFMSDGVKLVVNNIGGLILLFIPFIILLIFNRFIIINKDSKKKIFIKSGLFLMSIASFYLFLSINKDAYKLYFEVNNVDLNVHTFGVLNTCFIDTYRTIFGFGEKIDIIIPSEDNKDNDNEEEVNYEYNNLDIDFDTFIEKESNDVVKQMHEYFKNETGTLQNEYTNFFKGKNLILFMAESFNEIAVSEKYTPTLYKLVNNGFIFENFYTPTISSTIGGEFQELTGLVAASGFISPWKNGTNSYPLGIANVFKRMGYNTYAYHDHNIYFQNRYIYLKSLGFTNFLGCNNGLEKNINCKIWPESDVEMISATVSDYINSSEPFMVYYATVSGHGGYSFSANAIARKNKDLVSDLDVSEGPKAYVASQIELDKALEKLINYLDDAGVLEDTVIALVGDHYPYYLSMDEVNELASYEKDDIVEVNRSNFILWNSEMDNVVIKKTASQIDVLPTIYNLFGVKYDSRLIMGKDILSNSEGLAIFGNRSWVSDKGTYYAKEKKFVGESVSDEYLKKMNLLVDNRVAMSQYIMKYNYYKKVLGD